MYMYIYSRGEVMSRFFIGIIRSLNSTNGQHNPGAINICLRDFTPGIVYTYTYIQPGRGYVEIFFYRNY